MTEMTLPTISMPVAAASKRILLLAGLVAVFVIGLDQLTKWLVVNVVMPSC
jgi:lipoprotein signal peptidase